MMNAKRIILILLSVAIVTFLFLDHRHWSYVVGPLHNLDLGYPFPDMQARLGMAQGVAEGIDVNRELNPYTNNDHLNNKPLYTLHVLSFLGIGTSAVIPMGIIFGCTFLAWCFWLLRPSNWLELIIYLVILLSPPSLLLIERGNDDIIIFSFILLTPLLLKLKSPLGPIAAWSVISFLTPMKYYPAAAYCLFLVAMPVRKFLFVTLGTLAYGSIVYLLIRGEMQSTLLERIPDPSLSFSVGGQSFFYALIGIEHYAKLATYGATAIILVRSLFFGLALTREEAAQSASNYLELYFILGFSLFFFCFILNSNWDYRLAFLIPTLPVAVTLLQQKSSKKLSVAACLYLCSMILIMWAEYICFFVHYSPQHGWTFNKNWLFLLLFIKHAFSWVCVAAGLHICTSLVIQSSPLLADLRKSLKRCTNLRTQQ